MEFLSNNSNYTIQKFIVESNLTKEIYYKLRKDDSSLTCEQANNIAKVLGISYHDLQVKLGYETDKDIVNNMTLAKAKEIVFSNKVFLRNHGLETHHLRDGDYLAIALILDSIFSLIAAKYKK